MEISNNVIIFPKQNLNIQQQITETEIKDNVDTMRHYHIQETILALVPMLFNQLSLAGFDFDDDDEAFKKDGALLIEAIRSMLCKTYGMEHPFQLIAESVFESVEHDPDIYKIVEELNLRLKEASDK